MGPSVGPGWVSDRARPSGTLSRALSRHSDSHSGGKLLQEPGGQFGVVIPVPGGASVFIRGQALGLPTLCPALDSRPTGRATEANPQRASSQLPQERQVRPLLISTQIFCFPLQVNIYTLSPVLLQCCRGHQSSQRVSPVPGPPEVLSGSK